MKIGIRVETLCYSTLILSQNNHGDLPLITYKYIFPWRAFGPNTVSSQVTVNEVQLLCNADSTHGKRFGGLMVALQDVE